MENHIQIQQKSIHKVSKTESFRADLPDRGALVLRFVVLEEELAAL